MLHLVQAWTATVVVLAQTIGASISASISGAAASMRFTDARNRRGKILKWWNSWSWHGRKPMLTGMFTQNFYFPLRPHPLAPQHLAAPGEHKWIDIRCLRSISNCEPCWPTKSAQPRYIGRLNCSKVQDPDYMWSYECTLNVSHGVSALVYAWNKGSGVAKDVDGETFSGSGSVDSKKDS